MSDALPIPPIGPLNGPAVGKPLAPKRRSGSQTRRMSAAVRVHCLPEQRKKLDDLAARSGQTVSALCLNALLSVPLPPKRRQPTATDGAALVRMSGAVGQLKTELSRVGSNLNQVAHHLNAGREAERSENSIAAALAALQETVEAIKTEIRPMGRAVLEALGQRPKD